MQLREYGGAPVRSTGPRTPAQGAGMVRVNSSTEPASMCLHEADQEVDAQTVLRVVSAFEDLAEGCASLADLASSVASWAGCPAGLSGPGGLVFAHRDPAGRRVSGGEPEMTTSREVWSGDALVARIWIERCSADRPLEALVLDRGARAAHQIIERISQSSAEASRDASWVAILIDADASPDQRARACAHLGYGANQPIRIAVSRGPAEGARAWTRGARSVQSWGVGQSRMELHGDEAIVVMPATAQAEALAPTTEQARWGVGPAQPALEAPRSYRWAREALRFAHGPGAPSIAHFDQLGSLVALAGVDADLMDIPDRAALAELAGTETGMNAILTAEVLMRTGSQRDAAACMNLHHSTVAHRVGHVEQALGYGLGEHSNWFRAQLAIHLWRLSWPDHATTPSPPAAGQRETKSRHAPDDSGMRAQFA